MTGVQAPRRPTRTWLVVLGVVGMAVAVAVIVLVVAVARTPTLSEALDAEIAALRAAGYATTYEELAASAPSDADNGAPVLDAAMEDADSRALPHVLRDAETPSSLSPEERQEVEAFVESLRLAFDGLDAAAARPQLHWTPRNWEDERPEIARLQRAFRLLALRAKHARDVEDRLVAARTQIRLAGRLQAGDAISAVVASALANGAVGWVRESVETGTVEAQAARRVLDTELVWDAHARVASVARGEIVGVATLHSRIARGEPIRGLDGAPLVLRPWMKGNLPWIAWYFGTSADTLRDLRSIAELPPQPYAEWKRAVADIDANASKVSHLTMLMFPPIVERQTRSEAAFRLARVALAVKERHETSGRWPTSLDELRDAFPAGVPLDPYTDAPFAVAVGPDVVRISSLGRSAGDAPRSDAELVEHGLLWEFTVRK